MAMMCDAIKRPDDHSIYTLYIDLESQQAAETLLAEGPALLLIIRGEVLILLRSTHCIMHMIMQLTRNETIE
jgi:hypothetical protein